MAIELLLGVGLPILSMASSEWYLRPERGRSHYICLGYVVKDYRYTIVEDFGCGQCKTFPRSITSCSDTPHEASYPTLLVFPAYAMWSPLIGSASVIYACRSI
jgi:hypothetical protein